MSADREGFAAAAAAVEVRRRTGCAALIAGLRRDPAVAAAMTLESMALPPVPHLLDGRPVLSSLLVVRRPDRSSAHPPWGLVTWDASDGSVVRLRDWRDGSGPDVPLETARRWGLSRDREAISALLARVDAVVTEGTGAERLLLPYRDVLPPAAFAWYRAAVLGIPWFTGGAVESVISRLGGWLREARALAVTADADALVAELDEIAAQRGRARFRVAVIGEVNRGKSTLVNHLLGVDALPTGPVPTTWAQVEIAHAERGELTAAWPDGTVETRQPGEWVGLSGGAGPAPAVRLTVASPWLARAGVELVDTAGANDFEQDRQAALRTAVTRADGVVLVVSAGAPLSRTEQDLLEQEVARRAVPFVAVVLTFLDQLTPADAETTAAAVTAKVRRVAPGAVVLRGPGPHGARDEVERIRACLADFAGRDDNRHWRSRKLAVATADVCEALADVTEAVESAATDSEAERLARLADERQRVERDAHTWDRLGTLLEERRIDLVDRLRARLVEGGRSITETLHHELTRAPDPKDYWERDLPRRLRRELVALTRRCEEAVLSGLAKDVAWLEGALAQRFGVGPGTPPVAAGGLSAPEADLTGETAQDLGRTRLLARIGAAGGALSGYVFGGAASLAFPPMALALMGGVAATLVAEKTVRSAVERNRELVRPAVERAVDDAVTALADDAADRVRDLYTGVLADLRGRRSAWRSARLASLTRDNPPVAVGAVATRARTLADAIRAATGTDQEAAR